MKKNKKLAFTLAEVISVLVILGVVAAITIPTATKKITERQNRTKVAKAIADYEKLISKFTIENQLSVNTSTLNKMARYNSLTLPPSVKSNHYIPKGMKPYDEGYEEAYNRYLAAIDEYDAEIDSGECENIRKYFKISTYSYKDKKTGQIIEMPNKCMFKSGELWWNVYNLSNTIIAFEPEILLDSNIDKIASDYDDNRAFYLTTVKDSNGSYRNNYTTETRGATKEKLAKAYDYAFNKKLPELACSEKRKTNCFIYVSYGEPSSGLKIIKDENGKPVELNLGCNSNDDCSCRWIENKDNLNDGYLAWRQRTDPNSLYVSYKLDESSLDKCLDHYRNVVKGSTIQNDYFCIAPKTTRMKADGSNLENLFNDGCYKSIPVEW